MDGQRNNVCVDLNVGCKNLLGEEHQSIGFNVSTWCIFITSLVHRFGED